MECSLWALPVSAMIVLCCTLIDCKVLVDVGQANRQRSELLRHEVVWI